MVISTLQRFGTLCMFVGSIFYNIFMLHPSHALEIGFFQLVASMSIIVIGSILSCGLKAMDDRFLKTLGINLYIIGFGYIFHSLFVAVTTMSTYSHAVIGGILLIVAVIFIYLGKGKPTTTSTRFPLLLVIFCSVLITIMHGINIPAAILIVHDKAVVALIISTMFVLNWILLYYISTIKTQNIPAEPDVIFIGRDNIFDILIS
ncbi:uncharacterized protein CEXT_168981 [Caerostris extrusa]|uniref:Uncharacterized protein n=1 Tax=Caerostris extrusa TaxID=172846 RepID=A0AAV4PQ62_CAEEX|nr:uncharacterized protein CEXT_168981 [Caerostris extrusa]